MVSIDSFLPDYARPREIESQLINVISIVKNAANYVTICQQIAFTIVPDSKISLTKPLRVN